MWFFSRGNEVTSPKPTVPPFLRLLSCWSWNYYWHGAFGHGRSVIKYPGFLLFPSIPLENISSSKYNSCPALSGELAVGWCHFAAFLKPTTGHSISQQTMVLPTNSIINRADVWVEFLRARTECLTDWKTAVPVTKSLLWKLNPTYQCWSNESWALIK